MTAADNTYTLLTGEGEYRGAIDTVLERAAHEIVVFDRDLAALRLEDKSRAARLAGFLQAGYGRRMRIVVHDTCLLDSRMPRFMQLAQRHAHAVQVRQSPDNLRQLADTHVLR